MQSQDDLRLMHMKYVDRITTKQSVPFVWLSVALLAMHGTTSAHCPRSRACRALSRCIEQCSLSRIGLRSIADSATTILSLR